MCTFKNGNQLLCIRKKHKENKLLAYDMEWNQAKLMKFSRFLICNTKIHEGQKFVHAWQCKW